MGRNSGQVRALNVVPLKRGSAKLHFLIDKKSLCLSEQGLVQSFSTFLLGTHPHAILHFIGAQASFRSGTCHTTMPDGK